MDKFRSELKAPLDATGSGWSELDHIVDYLQRLLTRPGSEITTSEYRCSDTESSTVTRDTAAEVRDAIRLHHIKPDRVHVAITASATKGVGWDRIIEAAVWLWFTDEGNARQLDVDLESADKLLLMGVKTQVQNELNAIDSWPSEPSSPAAGAGAGNQINNFHGPVNVGAIGAHNSLTIGTQSTASPQSPSPSGEPSWWARTWRDHFMATLVTIVGTVVATVLLALWGISANSNTELSLEEVNWTDSLTFEATGTVHNLRADDEVWAFSRSANGTSGVSPRGPCEVNGDSWVCTASFGTAYESGDSYVITAAVLTRQDADYIRSTPRGQFISYSDVEGIPKVEDPGAIDEIATWRP